MAWRNLVSSKPMRRLQPPKMYYAKLISDRDFDTTIACFSIIVVGRNRRKSSNHISMVGPGQDQLDKVAFSVGTFQEVVDEIPVHLFGKDAGVFVVVVAAGKQRWEENSLQVRLRKVDERQVAKLLKDRRLLPALNDHLRREFLIFLVFRR